MQLECPSINRLLNHLSERYTVQLPDLARIQFLTQLLEHNKWHITEQFVGHLACYVTDQDIELPILQCSIQNIIHIMSSKAPEISPFHSQKSLSERAPDLPGPNQVMASLKPVPGAQGIGARSSRSGVAQSVSFPSTRPATRLPHWTNCYTEIEIE